MASGNNIYSKLNIEKKKGLQQSIKSSKGDGDKTSGVSQHCMLDRQYHETANDQNFSKYVSLLAHSKNIKIKEISNKLKY